MLIGNIISMNGKIRLRSPVIRSLLYLKMRKEPCGLERMGEDCVLLMLKRKDSLSLIRIILYYLTRLFMRLSKIREVISGYPVMPEFLRLILLPKIISASLRLMTACKEISL